MAQTHNVIDRATFVGVGDYAEMTVRNQGGNTVYYGQSSVSSSSNVGSISSGSSATIAAGYFFVAAAGLSSQITAEPVKPSLGTLDALADLAAADLAVLDAITGTPVVSQEITFTEVATPAAACTYTGTVTLPAGSTLIDIIVSQVAVWNDGTSASMQIGNAGDPDGYFTAVDLKATDLLANESINFDKQGGQGGADATAGSSTHIMDRYSASAVTITATVATGAGGGSTGRTRVTVVYSLPTSTYSTAATVAAT